MGKNNPFHVSVLKICPLCNEEFRSTRAKVCRDCYTMATYRSQSKPENVAFTEKYYKIIGEK